ncbi:MAG: thiol-disulfide oxidoreductase DCC family protein [Hyphomicrobiaceae bacterium]
MEQRPQIVFDTDCVLCSGFVHFILRHEREPRLQFIGAWSEPGLEIAAAHGLSRADLDETFLVVEHGRSHTKSDAALVIARYLRAPMSWLRLLRVVPRPLRDAAYTFIARRRYRWFGQKESCFRPPPGSGDRFVNE